MTCAEMRTALPLACLLACQHAPAAPSTSDAPSNPSSDAARTDTSPADATPTGNAPTIPRPTGTCPTIAPGDVTFSPAGIPPRKVNLAFDPSQVGHGPLIFYWYATFSSVAESSYSLGATLSTIEQAGGIVATPYADPSAGTFEWFVVNMSSKPDDFLVADEVVACLADAGLIDTTHIHAMGMSAGALQTTALSFLRASYIASVTTYSGGLPAGYTQPTDQDPANKFAAFIFDGGSNDDVFGVNFEAASQAYAATLGSAGHFTAICDHGGGHVIPLDAAPSVAAFFAANGWGAWPSPYSGGLPMSFPSYCTL
jgi:hypothetical protein